MTRRRKITILILVAVVFTVAVTGYTKRGVIGWVAVAYLHGIPRASEADEASGIARFVADNYHFVDKSRPMPDRPPIFCRPGGTGFLGQTPHTVVVYTITNRVEQEKIITLISEYRAQKNLRHVRVQFYREENWRTWVSKDGSRGGSRGKEDLIRTERF
jgi:hypothetical protein